MDLPPGFRFHPTDEELITHYLTNKSTDPNFSALAIGEVDMNKIEPWELPWRAKLGEKEWYFFCVRDKKYPTGLRTNRATPLGYWKATGKDKEIYRESVLVGMKKTLVFYIGRAPKGQKSNWVCHEYRLEPSQISPKSSTNDWVISRVFHKTSGGKKVSISGLGVATKMENPGPEPSPLSLPPLMDSETNTAHVHCFSSSSSIIPTTATTTMIQGDYYPDGFGFGPNWWNLQNLIAGRDGDIMSENSSVVSNEKKVGMDDDDNGAHQNLASIWSY